MPEPTEWIISCHTFSCQSCSSWISAGVRIARVDRRWVCAGCAEAELTPAHQASLAQLRADMAPMLRAMEGE